MAENVPGRCTTIRIRALPAAPGRNPIVSLWTALTRNRASTRADHPDARLRGRAYAIPFATVWKAALDAATSLPRWTVTESDPRAGEIVAESRTLLWRFTDDVRIRVSLDDDGNTRVDVQSASRKGSADLGTNARRIARFLHALDRHLSGHQGATREPTSI
jgi:uncharacterized protein (DUF1499 family)